MVWHWTKERGPVSGWSAAFIAKMEDAKDSEQQDEVIWDWEFHAKSGKMLICELQRVACSRLPTDESSLRNVFRETFDLISTLLTGVAAIETMIELQLALLGTD